MITKRMLAAGITALDEACVIAPSDELTEWLEFEQDVVDDPREAVVRWVFCAMVRAHVRETQFADQSPRSADDAEGAD